MAESFKARRRESPDRRKRMRKFEFDQDPAHTLRTSGPTPKSRLRRSAIVGEERGIEGSGEHFDFPCGVAENGWMGKRGGGTCVQGGFFQSIPSERSQPPLALLFCRDFFRKRAVLQFTLAWGRGFFCGGESRSIPIKDSKHSSFP